MAFPPGSADWANSDKQKGSPQSQLPTQLALLLLDAKDIEQAAAGLFLSSRQQQQQQKSDKVAAGAYHILK
jgi:hypothetical protein